MTGFDKDPQAQAEEYTPGDGASAEEHTPSDTQEDPATVEADLADVAEQLDEVTLEEPDEGPGA